MKKQIISGIVAFLVVLSIAFGSISINIPTHSGGGGSTSPAGSDGNIQYNDGSSFGANSTFFWNTDKGVNTHAIFINKSNSIIEANAEKGIFVMQSNIGDVSSDDRLVVLGDENIVSGNNAQSLYLGTRNTMSDSFGSSQRNIFIGDSNKGDQLYLLSMNLGFSNTVNFSQGALNLGFDNYNSMFGSQLNLLVGTSNKLGTLFSSGDNNFIFGVRGNILSGSDKMLFSLNSDSSNYIVNNNDKSFLFATKNTGTAQNNLLELSDSEGVRIGATSGESITMDGDDLYVSDNTEIDGYLVLGANTENGLTAGDINASTIYYDTLVAKSPTFLCEQETMWCKITLPQYHQELYVQFDEQYNPLEIKYDRRSYSLQQFNQQVCPINAKTQSVCNQIKNKWEKLKAKQIAHEEERAYKAQCLALGGTLENQTCYETTRTTSTYTQTTKTTQVPIYGTETVTRQRLDNNLQVIEYSETIKNDKIIRYTEEIGFKENCAWAEKTGYYCETKTELII